MALKILFYFVTLFKFQADLCRVVTVGPKRFPIEMYRPNRRSPNAMAAFNFLQGSWLPVEFLV